MTCRYELRRSILAAYIVEAIGEENPRCLSGRQPHRIKAPLVHEHGGSRSYV